MNGINSMESSLPFNNESDRLRGLDNIAEYSQYGRNVIKKLVEKDGFPAEQFMGAWESSKSLIDEWSRNRIIPKGGHLSVSDETDSDGLRGLRKISAYTGYGDKSIVRLAEEEGFPAVILAGAWESSKRLIDAWRKKRFFRLRGGRDEK